MPTYIVEYYFDFAEKNREQARRRLDYPQWNIKYGWDRDDIYNCALPKSCSTPSKSNFTILYGLMVYVTAKDPLEALTKALKKFELKEQPAEKPSAPTRKIIIHR